MGDYMNNIEQLKYRLKNKKNNFSKSTRTSNVLSNQKTIFKVVNKILITLMLFLITSIYIKSAYENKMIVYKNVYDTNFNFASINKIYKKYFGTVIPFQDSINKNNQLVFNETLAYSDSSKYKDGVKLTVGSNYLVPSLESGVVVFIGNKEGYGNTVIIQQVNGVDIWYSNLKTVEAKIYDYMEKGTLVGEADNELVLLFQKEGKIADYKEYIK